MSAQPPNLKGRPCGGGAPDAAATTPPIASARAFRTVLEAMSRPGTIHQFADPLPAPAPLSPAAAQVLISLSDPDAPLWLSRSRRTPEILRYLRFQTGAGPVGTPERAAFGCGPWEELAEEALAALPIGTPEYPDRSATVVVEVSALSTEPLKGAGAVLRGPGIDGSTRLWAGGATSAFWAWTRENAARFPLGLDFCLAAGDRIAGLPRSTVVEPA